MTSEPALGAPLGTTAPVPPAAIVMPTALPAVPATLAAPAAAVVPPAAPTATPAAVGPIVRNLRGNTGFYTALRDKLGVSEDTVSAFGHCKLMGDVLIRRKTVEQSVKTVDTWRWVRPHGAGYQVPLSAGAGSMLKTPYALADSNVGFESYVGGQFTAEDIGLAIGVKNAVKSSDLALFKPEYLEIPELKRWYDNPDDEKMREKFGDMTRKKFEAWVAKQQEKRRKRAADDVEIEKKKKKRSRKLSVELDIDSE